MIGPVVDVILPFNKIDEYLLPAINSVLASKGVKIRLILVDDRLDTSDPIPAIDAESVVILRAHGHGYGNAISVGLQEVNAEFFALMNADDLVHPNRIEHQIYDLVNTNSDLSIGRVIKFKNSGTIVSQKLGSLQSKKFSPEILLLGAYGADATWCCKSSVVKTWTISHNPTTDWITALNYFEGTRIIFSKAAIYFYRQHSGQITRTRNYAYNSHRDVYTSWAALCLSLGIPILDEATSMLVASPWALSSEPTDEQVKTAIKWLNDFEFSTNHRYSNLVNRRFLFLLRYANGKEWFTNKEYFLAFYGLADYLIEITLNSFRTFQFKKFLTSQ
jgi:glycosyltransferase involved in cell wall biosynthesis